ncbi:OmpA family protein [Pedobacter insulae]|uniref:OmpA family protein n=1 Tax=Pedobacter insulae TaxID=414048 RepID=A0A1I2Z8K3_9SPHI|nr:OmpA family protein [Pedobacter insulae]SFH33905.1 OmpA family protein [Pedobacter insulae]
MKKLFSITIILTFCQIMAAAQTIDPKKKAKQAAENRANTKVEKGIEKGLDKVEEGIGKLFKKKGKKNGVEGDQRTEEENNGNARNTQSSHINKKASDFVAGTNILFQDDFLLDPEGDFPAKWNTNGSGEVVKINGINGKWLEVKHSSIITPEIKGTLPKNYTIEFDLFLQQRGSLSIPRIDFGLTPVKDILREDLYYREKFFVTIARYNEADAKTVEYGLKDVIGNKNDFPLTRYVNKVLHISMAVNDTRIRIYLDGNKLIDLPRALTPAIRSHFFVNNVYTVPASEVGLLISNVQIAAAETDKRSALVTQLMETGSATTNAILFDVNKDIIKPASYEVIGEIGEAMQQNAQLKILIVGHTDSDGDAGANKMLSQKRAMAVKNHMINKYNIAASRIQTEGKGESLAVASNTTPEGKAKNRRVEFIKL